eukprot:360056-Chlamydomonas_euryale.AAC.8
MRMRTSLQQHWLTVNGYGTSMLDRRLHLKLHIKTCKDSWSALEPQNPRTSALEHQHCQMQRSPEGINVPSRQSTMRKASGPFPSSMQVLASPGVLLSLVRRCSGEGLDGSRASL